MQIEPHPLLDVRVFSTAFPRPIAQISAPEDVRELLFGNRADAPFQSDDVVRKSIRDLLRHGGFKPTGRNKPASEYLIKAVDQQLLTPINAAVDICNVVSRYSGLPISVVDADKVHEPLKIAVSPAGSEYVFNPAGQVLRLDGLLCLHDSNGPCANAVKDSQRTKTDDDTTRTISVVWGTNTLEGRSAATFAWYRRLLEESGAAVSLVHPAE